MRTNGGLDKIPSIFSNHQPAQHQNKMGSLKINNSVKQSLMMNQQQQQMQLQVQHDEIAKRDEYLDSHFLPHKEAQSTPNHKQGATE